MIKDANITPKINMTPCESNGVASGEPFSPKKHEALVQFPVQSAQSMRQRLFKSNGKMPKNGKPESPYRVKILELWYQFSALEKNEENPTFR